MNEWEGRRNRKKAGDRERERGEGVMIYCFSMQCNAMRQMKNTKQGWRERRRRRDIL